MVPMPSVLDYRASGNTLVFFFLHRSGMFITVTSLNVNPVTMILYGNQLKKLYASNVIIVIVTKI